MEAKATMAEKHEVMWHITKSLLEAILAKGIAIMFLIVRPWNLSR